MRQHTIFRLASRPDIHTPTETVPRLAREPTIGDPPTMPRLTYAVLLCTLGVACGGDDSGDEAATSPTTLPQETGDDDGASSSSAGNETTGGAGSSSGSAPESSSTDPGSSGGPADSGSTGPINTCDPVIPGEWNACHDADGNVDNTQCNWMGMGGAQGFIGCLTSSSMKGANVCFISDCIDACDCFAPPTTGTAEVVCDEILDGGGTGCALSCANGRVCPDGMECYTNLCFWPAAM
jgi:hypothetical protein